VLVVLAVAACGIDLDFDRQEFEAVPVSLSAPAQWPRGDTLRVDYKFRRTTCERVKRTAVSMSAGQLFFSVYLTGVSDDDLPSACTPVEVSDALLVPPPRLASFSIRFGSMSTISATVAGTD
jgi:hypothetical protein